jgi:hypothetical protein
VRGPGTGTIGTVAGQGQPPEKGRPAMHSNPAGELHDAALFEEISLLGALVLAASTVVRHLTPQEVDRALRLDDPVVGPPPADDRHGGSSR